MNEKMTEQAMSIILHAGDARTHCKKALDLLAEKKFEPIEQELKAAQSDITKAHRIQTDAIQDEIRGEKTNNTLLFTHAQDTLMTIYTELNLTKQLVKIFRNYMDRVI